MWPKRGSTRPSARCWTWVNLTGKTIESIWSTSAYRVIVSHISRDIFRSFQCMQLSTNLLGGKQGTDAIVKQFVLCHKEKKLSVHSIALQSNYKMNLNFYSIQSSLVNNVNNWLTILKLLQQIYFCNLPNILYLSILVTLSFLGWICLNQNNQDKWNACGYPHALNRYACSESLRGKEFGQPEWSREIAIWHERLTSLFLWYPKGKSSKILAQNFRRQSFLREHNTCIRMPLCELTWHFASIAAISVSWFFKYLFKT